MPSLAEMLIQNTSNTINQTKGGVGDVAQNLQAGVQLAQRKEQLQQQREQLEQQKGLVEAKKISILAQKSAEINKLPAKIRKSAIKNFLVPMGDQLGYPLGQTFLDALGADDVLDTNKAGAMVSQYIKAVETGDMETLGELSGPMTQMLGGDPSQLAKFTMDATKTANTVRAQQATLSATEAHRAVKNDQFEQTKTVQQTRRFTDFTSKMSGEVKSRFAKNREAKTGVRDAHTEFGRLMKMAREGKKLDQIPFNASVRRVAKAAQGGGTMTDEDVNDFKRITGLQNFTVDAINKYLTGDVNVATVKQLHALTKRTATYLDAESQKIADGLTPQFSTSEFAGMEDTIRKRSGLDAMLLPTLGGKDAAPKQKRESDEVASPRMIDQKSADKIVELIKSKPDELGEVIARDLKAMFPGATEEQINALIKKARK